MQRRSIPPFFVIASSAWLAIGCFSLPGAPEFIGDDSGNTDGKDTGDTSSDTGDTGDTGDSDSNDTDCGTETDSGSDTGSETEDDSETDSADSESDSTPKTCRDGIYCNTPPQSCADDTHLRKYEAQGYCDDSSGTPRCEYIEDGVSDCNGPCEAGVCTGDLCIGIFCNEPPPRECEEKILTFWEGAPGECYVVGDKTECRYVTGTITCKEDCTLSEDGQEQMCTGTQVCAGLVCALPPAPFCSGNELVSFVGAPLQSLDTGACACVYEVDTDTVTCENGCAGGKCQ